MAQQEVAGGGEDTALARAAAGRVEAGFAGRIVARLEDERDRWFLWLPVIYGAGVALYFALLSEPPTIMALVPVAVAVALRLVLRRGTVVVLATGIAVALTLGFAAAKLRTIWVAAPVLERQLNLVEVRGWVELVEPRAGRGQRLTLRVAAIRGLTPDRLPYRVRVRTMSALSGLAPGDAVRVRATLAPPALPALPGDYDFARAAFFQRLGGVGYALSAAERDAEAGPAPLALQLEASIARLRQAISQRVRSALPGQRGAIADALITGERGGISAETNAAYRDSGLFHILSISGLHMTIMAGAVYLALRYLLAAVPAIALRLPVKKIAAVAATFAALGYLMISGGAFATVRAWVMISIMFLAVLLDRPALALRNVAVSALLIMVVLPDSLLDVGFQMSFAAVVALVAAYEAIRDHRRAREGGLRLGWLLTLLVFFGGIVLSTLIASISVAPFAAFHFHKSQQYAILANLIAIPVCNLLVMPAALGTLVLMPLGLEALALWPLGLGIDIMSWCAVAVAALPGAVGRVPAIPVEAFALMVAGGLWLVIWRTRWRLLGIAGIAAGLAVAPTLPRPDVLVGREGQAVAVRGDGGSLSALVGRGAQFELSRWLEHDGDIRTPRDVSQGRQGVSGQAASSGSAAAGQGFRCDAGGCTAMVKGVLVAVARQPSALADDCARAGLLILTLPRPRACEPQGAVIDLYDLRDRGTHAVYLAGGSARIVTVADLRGNRPWTGTPLAQRAFQRSAAVPRGSRLAMFAAPFDLGEDGARRRPEIEDDELDAR